MRTFADYQLKEYERIAEAHFKTADAISSFFRYYLVIMSLPATAAALLSWRAEREPAFQVPSPLRELSPGLVLLVVASIGYCLMLYLSNLRMDGLLYARTVNGIRKYFYDKSNAPLGTKQRTRVLPQTPHAPAYLEPRYFGPVVLTFLLLDTSYFVAGLLIVGHQPIEDFFHLTGPPPWQIPATSALFALLHVISYRSLARHREHTYLQRSAIGIDIDGVLNLHRERFCEVLAAKTQKNVLPEDIKTLPVRDTPELKLTNCDEFMVFHDVDYWTQMPAMAGAAKALQELRDGLNLKIYIFSYRPWPIPVGDCPPHARFNLKHWSHELKRFRHDYPLVTNKHSAADPERLCGLPRNPIERARHRLRDFVLDNGRALYVRLPCAHLIDRITHIWLYKNSMQYDRIVIEKGHSNLSSQSARFMNRFTIATRYNIRFFVEDDLEKAVKMAYICDVVFLIDHPYNRDPDMVTRYFGKLPSNIVRVKDWDEIRRTVRRLS
jgi:uncharacterized HAD superfamily protein